MKRKYFRVLLSVVLALSLCMVMAVPVSAAGTLVVATVVPANNMAGAITTYPIEFTTGTTYIVDSVEMEFASGFDVSGATFSSKSATIGAGTIGVSGQVVTYTVTAPALINTSTVITITLSGIVNPAAGDYSLTVRTKSGVATIDEGTSADFTIVSAPVSFAVIVDTDDIVVAGTAFSVKVTAKDEAAGAGSTVTGYTGAHLIDFSSTASDPKTIPAFAVITFASGIGTSSADFILNAVETGKTITATDSEISVTGTSAAITVTAGAAHHLTITGAPAAVTAGVAFSGNVTVTSYDAGGNVVTTDTSTIAWTSSDGSAVLPSSHACRTSAIMGHKWGH